MDSEFEKYADIVLPLAGPVFTFGVGGELAARLVPGHGVAVQLGARKIYTGIVWRLHSERPACRTVKGVERLLYDEPLMNGGQMRLWEWIADYYMCSLGEVMRAALPSLLKPLGFSQEEFDLRCFRPRTLKWVSLAARTATAEALNETFERLKRAPRQYEALIELADALGGELFGGAVPARRVTSDTAVLRALEKKGIVTVEEREAAGPQAVEGEFVLPLLSEAQQGAARQIREQWQRLDTVLLHGATGSGKTEIYITLMAEQLAAGRDVLMLVPEIALTAQLIARLRRVFGDRVTSYHSGLTDRQRTETYLRLNRSRGGEVVVGVRSSLFLPLRHLGLIVVDEEHDGSFKQSDPAPRYNARDCAVVMTRLCGCKCLMGSATPSLESYMNGLSGKYGAVRLGERYGGAQLPRIVVSDTLRAARRNERRSHFNRDLLDRMAGALERGEQVMLFQNRRGFSPYVECDDCGWTARCPHCNVTLTLHKSEHALRCHYCGYRSDVPARCPSCGAGTPSPKGFGTEKVEDEIAALFPRARVARLDRDTTRSRSGYERIIGDFEAGRTDILVGTQMITKGFDFSRVSLVGILNADNLLNYPDFRAGERAFQLMTQVAGRAGRGQVAGEVVIQTSQPAHPVVVQVVAGDYEAMARTQLADRQAFFYPPYGRLAALTLKSGDHARLHAAAEEFGERLRRIFGRRLLGPQPPAVDRIKGEHLLSFLLKIESGRSFAQARRLLAEEMARLLSDARYRSVKVVCNIEP